MSELTEFEEARRRRRRKKNWRRTKKLAIVLAVVAVIGITVFAGRQLGWGSHLTNLAASLRGGKGFPVTLDRQETRQLIGVKGGVALCAEGSVTVYNTGGVITGEFLHSYNSPVSVYSGGRLLTYDVGGTDWMLTNKTKTLQSGTGSGILAIAALKLGAASAEGVDIDPVAVRTAGENAALNGVQDKLTVLVGDLSDKASGTYDIITANIVANAILSLAPAVPGLMAEGATFIASGIIDSRKDEVIAGLEKAGLAVVEVKEKRGWECIVCKKA